MDSGAADATVNEIIGLSGLKYWEVERLIKEYVQSDKAERFQEIEVQQQNQNV